MTGDLSENNQLQGKPAILGGTPIFNKVMPITRPTIPPVRRLKKRYEQVLRSGMITNAKYTQQFEEMAAQYLGVENAIAISSCTSGLMLIIKSLNLKGEVILPSFTFHATAHAIVWNGLKPVFVDCDPFSYNLDPREVEKAITSDTSAIIGVHIFGNPADIEALEKIASQHKLKLIFDAAHGFGAKYKGKKIGGFGDAESFSLSPTKVLTAAEGGFVTTNSDELAHKIRIGRNYGDPGTYDCEFSGLSSRMSEFNALLGIESLKIVEKSVEQRNNKADLYKMLLLMLPGIKFQKINQNDRTTYKDFSILIDQGLFGLSRDKLSKALMAENIIVKKYFYPPVHLQKAFAPFLNADKERFINTNIISENILSLPLYSHMRKAAIKNIALAVKRIHCYRDEINSKNC